MGIERGHEVIFQRGEACSCECFQVPAHIMGHWVNRVVTVGRVD